MSGPRFVKINLKYADLSVFPIGDKSQATCAAEKWKNIFVAIFESKLETSPIMRIFTESKSRIALAKTDL
ncbi:MAG: hypothetical protein JSS60_03230 [Verrucomicrobia bacterium]|nr:hypothetical protein [Verrucomicrobiota bacterium]